jgi:hypothetical protein
MISVIETFQKNQNYIYVRAIVEDMIQIYPPTLYDPPEYGPALCEASFELNEGEVLPEGEDALIDYLDELDIEWKIVDNSDYNYGFTE